MNKELTMINKLSKLTCIDESNFKYLLELVSYIIDDSINESLSTNSEYCDIDIGIGIITYKLYNEKAVFYKFEPYKKLNTININDKSKSLLDVKAKNKLIDALNNRYKEYL